MNLTDLSSLLESRDAIRAALRRGSRAMAAPTPLSLSQWADHNFYLSAESSYVEQRWSCYPFQRSIMDCISNDAIQEVWLRKSARVGYTKMILSAQAYFAEHKRRNQVVYQPTEDDADEYVKTELEPMLRDVSVMGSVFKGDRTRDKENTLRAKKFLGCILHIRGGKAAKNYRRLTVDVVHLDEVDGFDLDVEGEGSPVALARKRLEGATFPKLIGGSTPKIKGLSLIESREEQSVARFKYYVRCPHCNDEQPLSWGGKDKPYGFKWVDNDPETVRHLCGSCGSLFSQAEYLKNWQGRYKTGDGLYIDVDGTFKAADGSKVATPLSVGFHIWTAYSPQTSWSQIVREFLAAKAKASSGDKSELKTFVNTTLGEAWEEDVEKTDQHALRKRAEPYAARTCPRGVLILTAGVDVQLDRWEITTWGWGRGEEGWVVDHTVLHGNPALDSDWDTKLRPYLEQTFSHVAGGRLRIHASAVDTGGHYTHQAYAFVRRNPRLRVHAVKGDSAEGKPVKGRSSLQDINYRGQVVKRGVRLWLVGTDTAKDLLHGRLQVEQPGPGYVHFSQDLEDEFYAQLTAEHRVAVKTSRGTSYRWVKRRSRNEALDTSVYAIFAAHAADLHRYTDRHWEQLEQMLQPTLFDMPAGEPGAAPQAEHTEPAAEQATPAPQPPRIKRIGRVGGFKFRP